MRIVFGVLATILALGALLVVLRSNINEDNAIVKLITDIADAISGPFSRDDGIFDFTGKNAVSQERPAQLGDRGHRLPADRAFPGQRDRAQEQPLSRRAHGHVAGPSAVTDHTHRWCFCSR